MIFSSTIFVFSFLPIFLICLFFASNLFGRFGRLAIILFFSLSFYLFGSGIYVTVLIYIILINYYMGIALSRSENKKIYAYIGAFLNLLPLFFLKYGNFIISNLNQGLLVPALDTHLSPISLLLPAGISFFTFQGVSYLIDVYRGDVEPSKSLLEFATYESMFPQLVAGPIVRYSEVAKELRSPSISLTAFNTGIFYFGLGLIRKTFFADPLGAHVDRIFSLPMDLVTPSIAWIGAGCYTLQIFYDFAGYTEMAIGIGLMIGFNFPDNFRQPYRSQNITDFWRRWHMTLSRWFRDYLYIPLGGNRHGLFKTTRNLWIVFLLCGLWHGAAWTFVAWGAYHGTLLVAERVLRRRYGFELQGIAGTITTLVLVIFGWVLFRSESFHQAYFMVRKMLFIDTSGINNLGPEFYLTPYTLFLLASGFLLALLPFDKLNLRASLLAGHHTAKAAMLGLVFMTFAISELAANGFNPFIYFQF